MELSTRKATGQVHSLLPNTTDADYVCYLIVFYKTVIRATKVPARTTSNISIKEERSADAPPAAVSV
jgi:hypothetical protein